MWLFFTQHWSLCLGIRPRWLQFMSTNFWTEKKFLLNFNFCLSGYFKCSMITWDSTNMQKGISSSPKVFLQPFYILHKYVLRIDCSSSHPKTTLKFFFIHFCLLKITRLGPSPAYHGNHFSIFSRFQPSNIEEKITRITINTNGRAVVFRAPLLPHLFENWRETNTYARCRRMPSVTLNKQKFHWCMRSETPLCSTVKDWLASLSHYQSRAVWEVRCICIRCQNFSGRQTVIVTFSCSSERKFKSLGKILNWSKKQQL